jgi:hypothetical protein
VISPQEKKVHSAAGWSIDLELYPHWRKTVKMVPNTQKEKSSNKCLERTKKQVIEAIDTGLTNTFLIL